jgi:outer membrane protein
LILLLAPLSSAQRVLQLSLKQSVEIALSPEGSTRVALAEKSIERAQTRVDQAKAAMLPSLDGSVQERNQTTNLKAFGFDFNFPIPGFSIPEVVGPFNVFDARASLQGPVLDFTNLRRIKASRAGLEGARMELEAVRDQVRDRVARAYLAGLRADAALESARSNVELSKALLDLSNSQKAAGTGTGIEVTRAQVQLANDQQKLIVAENERRKAMLQLLRAMGLNLSDEVQLTDQLVYQMTDVTGVEAALKAAREARSDLRSQKQREETARLNYGTVEAERLPAVNAFGDYGAIGRSIPSALGTHTVGVSVKIPVFDGGRRQSRERDAELQYREEQIRSRDLDQQVELEIREALDSLRSAQAQVDTAREGLQLAQNELAQARRRYEAGVTSSIEVTDAQTRLDRARDNQIAALYNYNLARIDLAMATGNIAEYVNQ